MSLARKVWDNAFSWTNKLNWAVNTRPWSSAWMWLQVLFYYQSQLWWKVTAVLVCELFLHLRKSGRYKITILKKHSIIPPPPTPSGTPHKLPHTQWTPHKLPGAKMRSNIWITWPITSYSDSSYKSSVSSILLWTAICWSKFVSQFIGQVADHQVMRPPAVFNFAETININK